MMEGRWGKRRWFSISAFVVLCASVATVGFHEALAVTWLGRGGEYPFGDEGPAGEIWYYHSVERYAWVNGVSGSLWSLILAVAIFSAVKRNDKWLLIAVGCAMALFIIEMLNPLAGGILADQ